MGAGDGHRPSPVGDGDIHPALRVERGGRDIKRAVGECDAPCRGDRAPGHLGGRKRCHAQRAIGVGLGRTIRGDPSGGGEIGGGTVAQGKAHQPRTVIELQ